METKTLIKNATQFICNTCDYNTSKSYDFKKHLGTAKHRIAIGETKGNIKSLICPYCNKQYHNRSGLWKHQHKCTPETVINNIPESTNDIKNESNIGLNNTDLMLMILKENSEFKQIIMEQSKQMIKLAETAGHNNSHNKTFNMNFFLNETCKNAMNINEFVSSIKPTLEELEETGKVGYVAGITNVILNRLQGLEVSMKPMHCSDAKREILYIKDNDNWEKESDEKPLIKSAIKMIAHKNIKNISEWQSLHPGCGDVNSRKNNDYLKIVSNSMSGSSSDECNRNVNKIISNIAKETIIER